MFQKRRAIGLLASVAFLSASALAVANEGDKPETHTQHEAQPKGEIPTQEQKQTTPQPAQKQTPASEQNVETQKQPTQKQAQGQAQGLEGEGLAEPRNKPRDKVMAVSFENLDNQDIENVQQKLQELGYYTGKVDGIIGPMTRAAFTRYFQDQQRLLTQGMIGESTLSAFDVDVEERQLVRGLDPQAVREQRQNMGGVDAQGQQDWQKQGEPKQGTQQGEPKQGTQQGTEGYEGEDMPYEPEQDLDMP